MRRYKSELLSLVDVERESESVRGRAAGGRHSDDLVLHHWRAWVGGPRSAAASARSNSDQERKHQYGASEIPAPSARLNCQREERDAQEQDANRTSGGAPSAEVNVAA